MGAEQPRCGGPGCLDCVGMAVPLGRGLIGALVGAALAWFPAVLLFMGLGELAQTLGWAPFDATWNDGAALSLGLGSLGILVAVAAAAGVAHVGQRPSTDRRRSVAIALTGPALVTAFAVGAFVVRLARGGA
jgi:hypothetical protein